MRTLFCLGGILLFSVCITQAQNWIPAVPLNNARYDFELVSNGTHVYAAGGNGAPTSLEVYDGVFGNWTTLADLPVPQQAHCAALVGGKIYTFGNSDPEDDTVQIYNTNTDTWSAGPPLPDEMYWSTARAVDQNIYVLGGYVPWEGYKSTVYILNTTTLTWSTGTDCPTEISSPTSVVRGNNIFVFTEFVTYRYATDEDAWYSLTPRPTEINGSAACRVGNQVYLIGGYEEGITDTVPYTHMYDIDGDFWWYGPDMNTPRYNIGAIYFNDYIYAVGGRLSDFSETSIVEILTPIGGPGIQITLTTDSDPLPVIAGDNFFYDLSIVFNIPSVRTTRIVSQAILPSGFLYGPIFQVFIPAAPGTTIDVANMVQSVPPGATPGTYEFIIRANTVDGDFIGVDSVELTVSAPAPDAAGGFTAWIPSGVDRLTQSFEKPVNEVELPNQFSLSQPYPNPFNPTTTISVSLPSAAELSVVVFNALGQQVAELTSGRMSAGTHQFTLDGSYLASGIYFVHASVPGELNAVQKIVLMK
jgi:Secretion system C-terminal sorting domain/Kelch motif